MIDYRPLAPNEFDAFFDNLDLAFHERSTPAKRAQLLALIPLERTVAAFDGPLLVGTSAAFPQRLSVPGGELPCAGVTVITVRPTHRRRGLLTQMMAGLIEQARAAREPLAGLWAAEGSIYERFGYGVASRHAHIVLPGGSRAPRPSLAADVAKRGTAAGDARTSAAPRDGHLTLDLIDPDGAGPLLDPIWDRMRARRAGIPARTQLWWSERILADPEDDRDGALEKRLVVVRGAGPPGGSGAAGADPASEDTSEPLGYALYRARGIEPDTTLELLELVAPDPEAEALLWEYLCSVDLVGMVDAPMRPLDDAAPYRFADFRQPRVVELGDALWLRLVDLPAALQGRSWRGPLDLTLDVADVRLPDNAGRWRLQATADGEARCARTDKPADLVLDAAALGAAYLGGTPIAQLADAGRIAERTDGAVEAFDTALRTPRAPWTPEFF
ncbi:GNAT family N-acetyltransferase [Conexibacter sp. CPCC 206217]|uniref:GNAT family N-acetyltransferase n=1 Tax=Conexibacter sp. CPCC 206217 TaxID=3064574 RepID=UPI00271C7437|nr:GNAT family N-acetyltransferase [Conexibacter sp. CPCC 206217]MDO8210732.1 GNAT family N-acetyltransferase [Conexibacter sp. CPCC 206217]